MLATFTIPGQPVAQGRHRVRVVGKLAQHYMPKKTAEWQAQAIYAMSAEWRGATPIDKPVIVDVTAFFERPGRLKKKSSPPGPIPHTSRPDRDNIDKAALDSLTKAGVLADDKLAYTGLVQKFYVPLGESPRVEIRVEVE